MMEQDQRFKTPPAVLCSSRSTDGDTTRRQDQHHTTEIYPVKTFNSSADFPLSELVTFLTKGAIEGSISGLPANSQISIPGVIKSLCYEPRDWPPVPHWYYQIVTVFLQHTVHVWKRNPQSSLMFWISVWRDNWRLQTQLESCIIIPHTHQP